jgi:hypothetical protein
LSASGLLRTALPGGGLIIFLLADVDTGSKAAPPTGNVEDTGNPLVMKTNSSKSVYLVATDLPDVSLISAQAFSMLILTLAGIGT